MKDRWKLLLLMTEMRLDLAVVFELRAYKEQSRMTFFGTFLSASHTCLAGSATRDSWSAYKAPT